MTREAAWTHYFNTGDREPLVKAYQDSISGMARAMYPRYWEDYSQVGLMGLLKAIDRIDPKRVKSKDAWVWMNVRGAMYDFAQYKGKEVRRYAFERSYEEWVGKSGNQMVELLDPYRADDFDLLLYKLPAKWRLILSLIYRHDWDRTQIAKLFNLSSMRIGQIEKEALEYLRPSVR